METKERLIAAGDVVEVAGHRVGDTARRGEILEVMGSRERPHYRVRWDDGHESVFFPGSDSTVRPREGGGGAAAARAGTGVVISALRDADVQFEVLSHRRTLTAASEARALGVLPQETAKTVVVRANGDVVRAVVPASERLDLHRLKEVLGTTEPRLVDEAELGRLYPEFELGAVPPFAGGHGDRVVVDIGLCTCEYLVLEAGTHDQSIRIRTSDLLDLANAQLGEIATKREELM
jgi:Ala-tRNA(Pro) deacylase